jgi:hypothetical protein
MKTQTPQVHQARKMSFLRVLLVNGDGFCRPESFRNSEEKSREEENGLTGGTNQPSPSGGFQHPSLSLAYEQCSPGTVQAHAPGTLACSD